MKEKNIRSKEVIIDWIKSYAKSTEMKGAVIGISGGKDSTIVAGLLVEALGKENVLGVLMPNGAQFDIQDSKDVCKLLEIDYMTCNIEFQYDAIIDSIEQFSDSQYYFGLSHFGKEILISDKAKTNIAPRLRMTTLYTIAQTLGYRVAGTGNMSEQFIGWFTKWGDGACDFNPIAHLTSDEVIKIGLELGLPDYLVNKTPADGLTGKSDEENFGFTYKQLNDYIQYKSGGTDKLHNIMLDMHEKAKHKIRMPYNIYDDFENN